MMHVLSNVALVFDRFHVTMRVIAAVDKVLQITHRKPSSSGDTGFRNRKVPVELVVHRPDARGDADFRAVLARDLLTGSTWTPKESRDETLVGMDERGSRQRTNAVDRVSRDRHEAHRGVPGLAQSPNHDREEQSVHLILQNLIYSSKLLLAR